jgi:hypothetical protein
MCQLVLGASFLCIIGIGEHRRTDLHRTGVIDIERQSRIDRLFYNFCMRRWFSRGSTNRFEAKRRSNCLKLRCTDTSQDTL